MPRLLRFLPIVLGAWACRGETTASPPPRDLVIAVANVGEGSQPPSGFSGTWIDIFPGVEYRQTLVMGTGVVKQDQKRLNGHRFSVEDEYIVIGPSRYGPLPRGTRVEVRNEGVFAEGRLLGALPERIPVPADGK